MFFGKTKCFSKKIFNYFSFWLTCYNFCNTFSTNFVKINTTETDSISVIIVFTFLSFMTTLNEYYFEIIVLSYFTWKYFLEKLLNHTSIVYFAFIWSWCRFNYFPGRSHFFFWWWVSITSKINPRLRKALKYFLISFD